MSTYPAPVVAAKLTDEEADELIKLAFERERKVKAKILEGHGAYWDLAEALYEFHSERCWELVGYTELNEFLAQPEIGLERSSYFRAVQAWDHLVVMKGVAPARLRQIEPSKVQEILPAVVAGRVSTASALNDAEALGKRDLREKYANLDQIDAPLDASAEPEREQCPTCGSWVRSEKINDEALDLGRAVIEGEAEEL